MQNKPSKWVSGYKHGPAASYTQITRMGLFLNVATSKFEPLDSTWDNLHSGGMFISDDNKIYFRDETNKDIYINSPADNQLEIYASGGITAPLQPAFLAYKTTAQSNIAVGSDVTVTWNTEPFDQGGDFASNVFTAPVAGKYQLQVSLRLDNVDSAANYYVIAIITNEKSFYVIMDPGQFAGDPAYWEMQNTVLAEMDAGDTAYVVVNQATGTAQTDIDGQAGSSTYFSGFLVC